MPVLEALHGRLILFSCQPGLIFLTACSSERILPKHASTSLLYKVKTRFIA
jgi:hypothetical protein